MESSSHLVVGLLCISIASLYTRSSAYLVFACIRPSISKSPLACPHCFFPAPTELSSLLISSSWILTIFPPRFSYDVSPEPLVATVRLSCAILPHRPSPSSIPLILAAASLNVPPYPVFFQCSSFPNWFPLFIALLPPW